MIELYPFQAELVHNLREKIRRGFRSILLVSPTGSGKTVMFAYLCSRMAERGARSVVMAHREELLGQISSTLRKFKARHSFIAAGNPYRREPLTHVASVMSLRRRLETAQVPDYAIIDEAHHAVAGSTWNAILDHWRAVNPKLVYIGVTATPERLSGEGLGHTFSTMIEGPTTAQLIADGYLSRYKIFAPLEQLDTRGLHMRAGDFVRGEVEVAMSRPKIVGDAISHYRQYLNGAPCIGFAASVKSAHYYAEQYRAAGWKAVAIDGTQKDRHLIVRDFSRGAVNVLMSCDLISEGFDVPGAWGAQLLRPTESLALYLQQCGRVLRTAPGKEFAYVLDHVGNSARHGLPCDERVWTLEGRKRKGRSDPNEPAIRQCHKCGAVTSAGAAKCPECGHVFMVKARVIEETDGELSEVDESTMTSFRRQQGMAKSLKDLIEVGRARGMRNPEKWAEHVMKARQEKLEKRYGRYLNL